MALKSIKQAAHRIALPASAAALIILCALSAFWARDAIHKRHEGAIEIRKAADASEESRNDAPGHILIMPSSGAIIRPYSDAVPEFVPTLSLYETHTGVDFCSLSDARVFACADGVVESVFSDRLMGLTVQIRHDGGCISGYASLEKAHVAEGKHVKAGDVIGEAGESALSEAGMGRHLHFYYIQNGKQTAPPFTDAPVS